MLLKALDNRKRLEDIARGHNGSTYVTYLDALSRYGLISDMPEEVQCATPADDSVLKTPFGTIEFYRMPRDCFVGLITFENGIPVAEPEKAVVDALWISEERGLSPDWLESLDWTSLDGAKIAKYAEMMGIRRINEYLSRSRVK